MACSPAEHRPRLQPQASPHGPGGGGWEPSLRPLCRWRPRPREAQAPADGHTGCRWDWNPERGRITTLPLFPQPPWERTRHRDPPVLRPHLVPRTKQRCRCQGHQREKGRKRQKEPETPGQRHSWRWTDAHTRGDERVREGAEEQRNPESQPRSRRRWRHGARGTRGLPGFAIVPAPVLRESRHCARRRGLVQMADRKLGEQGRRGEEKREAGKIPTRRTQFSGGSSEGEGKKKR